MSLVDPLCERCINKNCIEDKNKLEEILTRFGALENQIKEEYERCLFKTMMKKIKTTIDQFEKQAATPTTEDLLLIDFSQFNTVAETPMAPLRPVMQPENTTSFVT